MSVQNESLEIKPTTERKPDAPELEYKHASQDSLSMFFAAIGGAVLGMLATLLVLAVINGGTLNFIHPERLAVLEQSMTRINENVGAVSTNVDAVAQQMDDLRGGLTTAKSDLEAAKSDISQQTNQVAEVATGVAALQVTGQRFETFMTALDQALTSVDRVGAANGVTAGAGVQGAGAPVVVNSDAVKPGDVAVLFFADANGNGRLDDSEANLVGVQVSVTDSAGKKVGDYSSTDGGILVEGLAAGQYTFAVTNAWQPISFSGNFTNSVTFTGNSGWAEQDTWDNCGVRNPPPFYPTTGRYSKNRYYEIDPVGFNVAAWFAANQ